MVAQAAPSAEDFSEMAVCFSSLRAAAVSASSLVSTGSDFGLPL